MSCLLYIVTVTLVNWDYVNRTAFKAPTRTLLFYYRDMQQKIVHTLLLEKYGSSKKLVIIMDRTRIRLLVQQKQVNLRLSIVIVLGV